jgi:hypothetical protein
LCIKRGLDRWEMEGDNPRISELVGCEG